jgi:endonuclease YncB( thermonuclease family)
VGQIYFGDLARKWVRFQSALTGSRSRAHQASLVMGKTVDVEWHKTDRYGRIVGLVRVQNVDAGLEQVRSGMAWHYKAYSKEQQASDRQTYAAAEDEARAKRGLWTDFLPQPPWEYRAKKRSESSAGVSS